VNGIPWASRLWWWRPPCLLREVLIPLTTDRESALRGVLWRVQGPWLVLRNVQAIKAGGKATPVDGEVILHRSHASFIQVLRA